MKQAIFVGNYSEQGINQLEFNNENQLTETLKIGNMANNSYICKYNNYLYSVIEIDGDEKIHDSGYITAYELDKEKAKLIDTTISYGQSPCFIIVDELRKILYVANYSGGSFAALKLEENGKIGKKLYYRKFEDISKIHHIQFSKDYKSVYIIDLGTDCIIEYDINYDESELNLIEKSKFCFPKETQPRHMIIDEKNKIYVVTEQSCEIYKLGHNSCQQLIMLEKKSILPEGIIKKENYTGCAIKIDSKLQYIYISVRGHNSISVFDIIDDNMKLIQNIKCEGNIPRDITLDKSGKYLFCANQVSNNISIFSIQNGKLSYQSEYKMETPTCIVAD